MRVLHVVAETPLSFLQHLKDITFIERRPLRYFISTLVIDSGPFNLQRFCAERLQSLVRTLDLTGLDEYHSLQKVASFATLVATYEKGKYLESLFVCFTFNVNKFCRFSSDFGTF
jgi:DNA excision repair protein ERCC-2